MSIIKSILFFAFFLLFINFTVNDEDVQNLKMSNYNLSFLNKISSTEISSKNKNPLTSSEGMTFCKFQFSLLNESDDICNIDLNEAYLVDTKQNIYHLSHLGLKTKNQPKFKAFEEQIFITYFEFPENGIPKKLILHKKSFLLKELLK